MLRLLLMHAACLAFSRAWLNTGNRIAARIAIIAITTSNSISVNAERRMTMHLLGWIYGTLNFAPLPWGCQGLKGRGSRSANDEFWRQQFRPFGHHPLAQSVGEFLDGTPTQLLYGLAHRRQGRV
jgi:hypothetical protein